MNNRVYGVLGISSVMANWNADFTGYPKTTSDGNIFGSDKALKYPMKKMWDNQGEKVLYIKSMKYLEVKKENKVVASLVPKTLKERYEQIFDVKDLKECTETSIVLKNLFQAVDVKNFGATFAESDYNISITGAVQIGQGFNKYTQAVPETQQILSPFRDGTEKKGEGKNDIAKNSSIGTKIATNEAHYFYSFSINPLTYKEYKELKVTDGYTEEDYQKFKNTSLVSTTSFATNSKIGCENEFGLFVETELDLYLPNLAEYISFEKGEEKNTITLNCAELLNSLKDKIISIEIYYNPYTTDLISDIKGAKCYNIFTQKEV